MTIKQAVKTRIYVIKPGNILARDGQWHFISGSELLHLYGVEEKQCLFFNGDYMTEGVIKNLNPDMIWLLPRPMGDYKEHLKIIRMGIFNKLGS